MRRLSPPAKALNRRKQPGGELQPFNHGGSVELIDELPELVFGAGLIAVIVSACIKLRHAFFEKVPGCGQGRAFIICRPQT